MRLREIFSKQTGATLSASALVFLCASLIAITPALSQNPTSRAHDNAVSSLALTQDGKLLISGGQDGKISFWETATGRRQRNIVAHVEGGPDSSGVVSIALFDGGKRLASAGDQTARV